MKLYRFAVNLTGYEEVIVTAPDKLAATKEAAKQWDVRWRETARDMIVYQISTRPVKG